MPNRLANETSPYLRQHAGNPVDWYPWGEEALQKAKAEQKPIFLSIGYSSCHWCHVMAHESFEDPAVADILNQNFVPIKVDREERPDLDHVYMSAVQAMTGQGGWPMSIFLTPDGNPFYGGTYFPPSSRGGMPSFTEVLNAVLEAWNNRRDQILNSAGQISGALSKQQVGAGGNEEGLTPDLLSAAFKGVEKGFEPRKGGWGTGPKFPHPMLLEFLLRYHHRTGEAKALEMVIQTLDEMARGGIYDQLGGGFHRYSVDADWLVPHFEKMLYDNALLARVYLHAWQVTDRALFRTIAEETLDYVLREMTDPSGGFYSTQDADTEHEEGKFYLWTAEEIRSLLGDDAEAFMKAYGVTEGGNFEGKNILTFSGTFEDHLALASDRRILFDARDRRVHPGRDEKALTSWNGLMLAAFAEAGRVLASENYLLAATRNAEFLLSQMHTPDGRLQHSWKEGDARVTGYLEDYADFIEGLLELYGATFDSRWYSAAVELAETMISHFGAPAGFYDTADDAEALILRPKELEEGATPSGNGMATTVLLRLAGLAVEPRYEELAYRALSQVEPLLDQYPTGFGQWLTALEYALSHHREIAVVGDPEAHDTRILLRACTAGYHPARIVAAGRPDAPNPEVPLLADRGMVEGKPTAYVCVDNTCLPPVTEVADLEEQLAA